jgi:iron(III) transport system ATP-binding protein
MAVVDSVEFHRGIRRASLSLCADRSLVIVADVGPNDAAYAALEAGRQVPLTLAPNKLQLFAQAAT